MRSTTFGRRMMMIGAVGIGLAAGPALAQGAPQSTSPPLSKLPRSAFAAQQTIRPVTKGLKPVPLPMIATETITYQPARAGPYCPSQLVAGDREFGGHGPEIWLTAEAYVTPDRAVEVKLTMRARETAANWSETVGTWTRRLTPPEMKVRRILSETRSTAHFVSAPAGAQYGSSLYTPLWIDIPPDRGALLQHFRVIGDTGGDDISDDDRCHDDTAAIMVFREMRLEIFR